MQSEQVALEIRSPETNDAREIWRLVKESGVLDANSAYLYLLLCRDFSDTCLVAQQGNEIVGFVTGYRLPKRPDVLFVWQVGVAATAQRQGIARRLLLQLVEQCGRPSLTAIEATVAPENRASRRLFQSLAETLNAPLLEVPDEGFQPEDFPPGNHEAEPCLRIGPLNQ